MEKSIYTILDIPNGVLYRLSLSDENANFFNWLVDNGIITTDIKLEKEDEAYIISF